MRYLPWLLSMTILFGFCYSAPANKYIEHPEKMHNGTTYFISPFTPKVFVKSDQFKINYETCVQFSYKLLEKKVRLHAYTCLLSEGGFCDLTKFSFRKGQEGCAYLRPWTHPLDTFQFYFVLERRARKYRPGKHRKQRIMRRMSTKPFGELTLMGALPCKEACGFNSRKRIA